MCCANKKQNVKFNIPQPVKVSFTVDNKGTVTPVKYEGIPVVFGKKEEPKISIKK